LPDEGGELLRVVQCKVSSHARAVAEAARRQVGRPVAHPAERIERARLPKATGDSLAVIYRRTGIPNASLHRYLAATTTSKRRKVAP